jgi:uncharacterized protein VirK/YbjX
MAVDIHQATAANNGFLRPLPALAQQKKTWAPDLLAGVVWRGLTNIGSHRKVVQLLTLPLLAETARSNPRFAYKYLTHDYLVRGLTTAQRAACFLHHYGRMHATLPDRTLRQTLRELIRVHEIPAEGTRFTVTMGLSRDFDKEGEFSLNLHVDGEVVFLLSFTIVPGEIVKSESDEVLLISRLQGMKGSYHLIQLATKALHNVAPDALLLASLQGLAVAFGIGEIAAVSAGRQSSCTKDSAAAFKQAYDEFFLGLGIEETADGFFLTPVPVEGKPLVHIKKGHKLRTKEKRAFKQSIQLACADFFAQEIANSAPELSRARLKMGR